MPSKTSRLSTVLVGTGLLTCVYLAALKLLNLPCPLSGCAGIINTSYGSLFHIPLPIYAVPLWVILAAPPGASGLQALQRAAASVLAAGAVVLMAIQFFVLKGFCPFCTIHAVAAIAVFFVIPKRGAASPWLPSAVLVAALPLILFVKVYTRAHLGSWQDAPAPAATPAPGAAVAPKGQLPAFPVLPPGFDKAAFTWLGDFDPKDSPILIISFQCPHCLDLIQDVLTHPHNGGLKGPRVFVYAPSAAATSDTLSLMAAMLSVPGTPQEQFAAVFSELDTFRDALITRDSVSLKRSLAQEFPNYPSHLAEAQRLYAVQMSAIKYVPGRGSPYLLLPDGTSKDGGDVTPDTLYH